MLQARVLIGDKLSWRSAVSAKALHIWFEHESLLPRVQGVWEEDCEAPFCLEFYGSTARVLLWTLYRAVVCWPPDFSDNRSNRGASAALAAGTLSLEFCSLVNALLSPLNPT